MDSGGLVDLVLQIPTAPLLLGPLRSRASRPSHRTKRHGLPPCDGTLLTDDGILLTTSSQCQSDCAKDQIARTHHLSLHAVESRTSTHRPDVLVADFELHRAAHRLSDRPFPS